MTSSAASLIPVNISLGVLLAVLLLVAVAVAAWFHLDPHPYKSRAREILVAGLRAAVQLAVVSVVIAWAVKSVLGLVAFLFVMSAVAVRTAGRRITGNNTWWLTVAPIGAGAPARRSPPSPGASGFHVAVMADGVPSAAPCRHPVGCRHRDARRLDPPAIAVVAGPKPRPLGAEFVGDRHGGEADGSVADDGDGATRLHAAGGDGPQPAPMTSEQASRPGTWASVGSSGVVTRVPSASGTRTYSAWLPPTNSRLRQLLG
ncbi:ABC transporter permease [Streptomyces sp. NPDC006476]|uniref:ABC transporter permease n=1 Tax=Streptomyces sp. NPDC006476 TaxID=3157175 RepID=UPI0033AE13F8